MAVRDLFHGELDIQSDCAFHQNVFAHCFILQNVDCRDLETVFSCLGLDLVTRDIRAWKPALVALPAL